MSGDLDADGLPLFPAIPGGRPVQPNVRSLARLVVSLRTAVLTVRSDTLAAVVVFLDREPVDGVAVRGDRRVLGPEALDEIEDVPLDRITVTEVAPELARELGSYFLPTELRAVPAAVVVGEDFVRSLARPGQRGCIIVRTEESLGLVFIADGGVVLAYGQDGALGGLEQVTPLLAVPGATLWARLGPDLREQAPTRAPARPAYRPPRQPAASVVPPAPVVPSVPVVPAAPVAPSPSTATAAERNHFAAVDGPRAVLPGGGPGPVPETPPAPVRAAPSPLEAVMGEVRRILGPHAVRVEGVFERAEPSIEGLRAAAESLRARRVRLISQATMDLVADRAVAVLSEHPDVRAR